MSTNSMKSPLKALKRGEYIQLKENGPVWVKGDYDRATKKFSICKADDMNHEAFKAGSLEVFHGFTY